MNPSSKFPPLNLKPSHLKLRKVGETIQVFDVFRKKWLVLTPEEWVRQQICHHMMDELAYPKASFQLEAGLEVGLGNFRTDVVIHRKGKPIVLLECKAPEVNITQETLDQATRYNMKLQIKHLLLSNGLSHLHAFEKEGKWKMVNKLPSYPSLSEESR